MEIKDLTLFGRMVFGINCFINYWNSTNNDNEENKDGIKSILKRYCTYTNTEYLDDWQEEILPFIPMCIFEAIDETGHSLCRPERCFNFKKRFENCVLAKDCSLVSKKNRSSEEQKYYQLYKKIDDDCLTILDMLYNIGASELFGKPTDMKESEQYLCDIINILKQHNVTVPNINDYIKFILNNPKRDMDFYGSKIDCTGLLDLL